MINEENTLPPHPSATISILALISYIGPLVILSYLVNKNNVFVTFHIKQGFLVFGIEILTWLFGSITLSLWPVFNGINIVCCILSIIGIVHVIHKKPKELPLIGHFSTIFTF